MCVLFLVSSDQVPDLVNIKYPGVTFMVILCHYASPLRSTFGPQSNQDFLHESSRGFTPAVNHLLRLKKASVNWALTMINKLLEDFCSRQQIILCLPVWLLLLHYEETGHSCSGNGTDVSQLKKGASSNFESKTINTRVSWYSQYPYSFQSVTSGLPVNYRCYC